MATPVGPVERDPNDPDLWDWGDGDADEEPPAALRNPARAIVAIVLVAVLVAAVAVSLL